MFTLIILGIYTVIGTLLSLLFLCYGYKKAAKIMFFERTLAPVGFILMLILVIGMAPANMG